MTYNQKARIQQFILLTPGALLFGVFNFAPLVTLLGMSLVDWPGIGTATFVGFKNFQDLTVDPFYRDQLLRAFGQNLLMFFIVISAMLLLGTGMALLLSFAVKGRNVYRAIYFLPYPLAAAAVAFLMDLMVQSRGPINAMLISQGFVDSPVGFLGDTDLALPTLSGFYVWHRLPFAIVLILSAIVGVRVTLLEASVLDGASRWQSLKAVVFPVLTPAFVLISVIVMVDVFNNADYILLLMGPEAGPLRSTDVMGTFLFRASFGGSATSVDVNFGMAATIGLVTAILILPAALVLALRIMKSR